MSRICFCLKSRAVGVLPGMGIDVGVRRLFRILINFTYTFVAVSRLVDRQQRIRFVQIPSTRKARNCTYVDQNNTRDDQRLRSIPSGAGLLPALGDEVIPSGRAWFFGRLAAPCCVVSQQNRATRILSVLAKSRDHLLVVMARTTELLVLRCLGAPPFWMTPYASETMPVERANALQMAT